MEESCLATCAFPVGCDADAAPILQEESGTSSALAVAWELRRSDTLPVTLRQA